MKKNNTDTPAPDSGAMIHELHYNLRDSSPEGLLEAIAKQAAAATSEYSIGRLRHLVALLIAEYGTLRALQAVHPLPQADAYYAARIGEILSSAGIAVIARPNR